MSTQAVTYCTTRKLNCCPPALVVLCVPCTRTFTGKYHINATLSLATPWGANCGSCAFQYTFEYDDTQLLDPLTPLTGAEITGSFCKECWTSWVEDLVGSPLIGWTTDGVGNFVQQVGSNGNLYFDNSFAQILPDTSDGADSKSISLLGGGSVQRFRGAVIQVFGNEVPAPDSGNINLITGDIAGASINLNGVIKYRDTDQLVISDTIDTADTSSIAFCGGGAASSDRGAYHTLYGNEQPGVGGWSIQVAGSSPNAKIVNRLGHFGGTFEWWNVAGNPLWSINESGSLSNDATNGGSLAFQKAITGVELKSGANGRTGTFTLNGATPVTVTNTTLDANDILTIERNVPAGTPAPYNLTARTAGVSFQVTGTAGDTSTMQYFLIRVN